MKKRNIIPGAITALILIALIISGNAAAFIVEFTADKNDVLVGEKINFDVKVDVEATDGEIDFFKLDISGEENRLCRFDLNGSLLSRCKGVTIEKTNETNFGYGYGYGYGIKKSLEYKIVLDTLSYKEGDYKIKLILQSDGDIEKEIEFTISKSSISKDLCSVRAKNGDGFFDGEEFNKNKLNFFISQNNAKRGSGSLTMQDKGERVSFSFKEKDVKVIGNNSRFLVLSISGDGRFNREPLRLDESIIRVDKINMKASIFDNDGNVIVRDMEVYFIKGC